MSAKHARSNQILRKIAETTEDGDLVIHNQKLDVVVSKTTEKVEGKPKGAKIALVVAGVLLALVLGCGLGLLAVVGYFNSSIGSFDNEEEKQALLDALAPAEVQREDAVYVAILGTDSYTGDSTGHRSDVIMVARVDKDGGVVDLVSIPRDTMVTIEGHGTQKINAAFAFGGAAGAVECLSEFAGVPISHYVEVRFDDFENAIDLLGGIDVVPPVSFRAYDDTWFEAGQEMHLSGSHALTFVRDRSANPQGDFGRAEMQRLVLMAIADKVLESSTTAMPSVIGQLARCVTTDYTVPELADMALRFKSTGVRMYSAVCPSYTLNQGGVSYVGTKYVEWQDMMRRLDAGMDPNSTEAAIPEPQASDTALGAATNGASPRDYADLAASAGMTTG